MKFIFNKNLCIYILLFIFIFSYNILFAQNQPIAKAKAVILIDQDTGTVLYSFNPDQRLPMASTTKVMTALIAIEKGKDKFDDVVTVSKKAGEAEGSSVLLPKEKVIFKDLFKAALIASSNEATIAMAEYLCGSEDEFVKLMNERAKELGMTNTHFVNSHGLYAEGHYSSARDLATLGRYVFLNYPQITEVSAEGYKKPVVIDALPRKNVVIRNHNKLLGMKLPGFPDAKAIGLKTGFVNQAGRCLVSAADYHGIRLIAVVLGSDMDYFKESAEILAYGYKNYDFTLVSDSNTPAAKINIRNGNKKLLIGTKLPSYLPKSLKPKSKKFTVKYVGEKLKAPITAGTVLPGKITVFDGKKIIFEKEAVAINTVEASGFIIFVKWFFGVIITLTLLIIVMRLINGTIAKNNSKRRNSIAQKS